MKRFAHPGEFWWTLVEEAVVLENAKGETLRKQLFPETNRKRDLFSGPLVFLILKLS